MGQASVIVRSDNRVPRFYQQLFRKGISYSAATTILCPALGQEADLGRIHWIPQCR
jgi:hypothetical protein